MDKIKIKFTVSYDGTDFCGWQKQNHGHVQSVAYVLEGALSQILNEPVGLYASGRTDAGVHAVNQVCHFETAKPESFFRNIDFAWAVNSKLPPSIVVKNVWLAPAEFHSTISAQYKTYRYLVYCSDRPSAFLNRYSHWSRQPLDTDYLNSLSSLLIGTHDFKSFQSVGTEVPHTIRTIYRAHWLKTKANTVEFRITGSGFLKQMVRNIVGTQLYLERTKENPKAFAEIVSSLNRQKAKAPAPPQGLYLWKVYYPKELESQCQLLKKEGKKR